MTKPVSSLCDHPFNGSMLQLLRSSLFVAAVFSSEANGGTGPVASGAAGKTAQDRVTKIFCD